MVVVVMWYTVCVCLLPKRSVCVCVVYSLHWATPRYTTQTIFALQSHHKDEEQTSSVLAVFCLLARAQHPLRPFLFSVKKAQHSSSE